MRNRRADGTQQSVCRPHILGNNSEFCARVSYPWLMARSVTWVTRSAPATLLLAFLSSERLKWEPPLGPGLAGPIHCAGSSRSAITWRASSLQDTRDYSVRP